jgi:hypothetical protein
MVQLGQAPTTSASSTGDPAAQITIFKVGGCRRAGKVISAAHGHITLDPPAKAAAGDQAGLMARPGQSIEHVIVPDHFAEIKDPADFGRRLKEHLARLIQPGEPSTSS